MAIFLFPGKDVFAQVVINKFSSDNGTDWVEVYNTGGETIDLKGNNYQLRDTSSSGNPKDLDCLLSASKGYSIDWGNSLNKDGDRINLFKEGVIVDCVAYGDGNGFFCGEENKANLEKLVPGEYGVRDPTGIGNWVKTSDSSKRGDSECLTSLPATPTPSLSPTSATYQINDVKDEDGNSLSSVKVYLDDFYLHHYAPETLTFCNGCQCDTYVVCDFGEHTIKLEKSGFANWSKTKTLNPGDYFEVNPIMSHLDSDSSSSFEESPSPSPDIVPTPSPKPIQVTGAALLGKILGEEATPAALFPWEATKEAESQEATGTLKVKLIPKLFLGFGLVFLAVAGIYLWYNLTKGKNIQG